MAIPAANFSTPAGWVTYASTATNGLFWPLMLIAIFVISFGTLAGRTSTSKAFASSSFLNVILAMFLSIIGGIDGLTMTVSIALAVGGFAMLLFAKE